MQFFGLCLNLLYQCLKHFVCLDLGLVALSKLPKNLCDINLFQDLVYLLIQPESLLVDEVPGFDELLEIFVVMVMVFQLHYLASFLL